MSHKLQARIVKLTFKTYRIKRIQRLHCDYFDSGSESSSYDSVPKLDFEQTVLVFERDPIPPESNLKTSHHVVPRTCNFGSSKRRDDCMTLNRLLNPQEVVCHIIPITNSSNTLRLRRPLWIKAAVDSDDNILTARLTVMPPSTTPNTDTSAKLVTTVKSPAPAILTSPQCSEARTSSSNSLFKHSSLIPSHNDSTHTSNKTSISTNVSSPIFSFDRELSFPLSNELFSSPSSASSSIISPGSSAPEMSIEPLYIRKLYTQAPTQSHMRIPHAAQADVGVATTSRNSLSRATLLPKSSFTANDNKRTTTKSRSTNTVQNNSSSHELSRMEFPLSPALDTGKGLTKFTPLKLIPSWTEGLQIEADEIFSVSLRHHTPLKDWSSELGNMEIIDDRSVCLV